MGSRNSSRRSSPGVMGGSWAMVPSVVVGSVVVDNLDAIGAAVTPDEGNAELIVDSDAVLAAAISREGFEAVPGPDAWVIKGGGHLQLEKLALRHPLEGHEPPDAGTVGEGLGVRTAERLDHPAMVTRDVTSGALRGFGRLVVPIVAAQGLRHGPHRHVVRTSRPRC